MKYRIRWANVQRSNGHSFTTQRMCIAERRHWFGWFPLLDGDWCWSEAEAMKDIEHHKSLRSPLPKPIEVQ